MTKKGTGLKIAVSAVLCLFILLLAIRQGSVYISLKDLIGIIGGHITGKGTPDGIEPMLDSIFWTIRMPRAIMAFMVGGALSISGACMQALLQNPLASSYTLGVSSGASLGAALVIILEISIPVLAGFMLPFAGFVFGLITVVGALMLASAIDRSVSNTTVVLIGMILSLFVNGIMNAAPPLDDGLVLRKELDPLRYYAAGMHRRSYLPYADVPKTGHHELWRPSGAGDGRGFKEDKDHIDPYLRSSDRRISSFYGRHRLC